MEGYWHEHRVRERAYQLWEAAGRPDGRSDEFWQRAEAEIVVEDQEASNEADLESKGAV
jgi:Protein of unknown function (DUF2934)